MSFLPFVSIGECQDKLNLVLEKKGGKYQGISDSIPTMQKVTGNCEGVQVLKSQKGQLGPVSKERKLPLLACRLPRTRTFSSFSLSCLQAR